MHISPVETIRHKRDGLTLSSQEIKTFVSGIVSGEIPEYQASAFLMATFFQGMALEETVSLTQAMIESGSRVSFNDDKPKIDKHSTGGVGDKVSIILAPLVASLGVDVPMVSGRGLGHTGGTLDKLESIPGFKVQWTIEQFKDLVRQTGMGMMGQTSDFVPADKMLYALRDVTATVECIPLITASILSKKAAEGISGLVLDIKVGSGAFMKTQKDAEKLARMLVSVGKKLGLRIRALLTDMNQPLGFAVGNSIEILECIDVLQGEGPSDLKAVTIELASHMLVLGEKSSSLSAARLMAKKALQDGSALKKFAEMCKAQGATVDVLKNPDALTVSPHSLTVRAPKKGILQKIDGFLLGTTLIQMGGGREKASDKVDPKVGFLLHAKTGDSIDEGEDLVSVFYCPDRLKKIKRTTQDLEKQVVSAFSISNAKVKPYELIKKVIE